MVVVYDQQLEVVVNQLDDRPAVRYVAGNDDFIVRWHDGFGDFDVRVGRISSSHLEFAIAHVGDEDTVIQTNLAAAGAEGETQAQQG
ncbi:hypothetical protein [Stenotrophomonas indicatrix]|uniref:hypothetical protein n=1 Tax=Stenotrophomonas indicatrix TaxID=2045451 RepID=UPI0020041491|nr:hypothetical protein [Stenotrophomonas indicatrix]MCK6232292.1 hypothetical protein [Stenotrophomonas indicatrix]